MHYCCLVLSDEFPNDEVLRRKLRPFNDEVVYDEDNLEDHRMWFAWDWFQIGGRYNGMLKLSMKENDDLYEWNYYQKEPRSGRLFRSSMLENMRKNARGLYWFEDDFYPTLGGRDGYLNVDAGRIADIINMNDVGCYCFIDRQGNGCARDYHDGDGLHTNESFEDDLKKAISDCKDGYICVVDLHD